MESFERENASSMGGNHETTDSPFPVETFSVRIPAAAIYSVVLLVVSDEIADTESQAFIIRSFQSAGFHQFSRFEIIQGGRSQVAGIYDDIVDLASLAGDTVIVRDKKSVGQPAEFGPCIEGGYPFVQRFFVIMFDIIEKQ